MLHHSNFGLMGGLTRLNFIEYANFKSRIKPLESQVNTVPMRCCSGSESRGSVVPQFFSYTGKRHRKKNHCKANLY